uniref:Major facilitator superfamily protein n=1 Tax=Sphingobacterium sp. (strain 21) TaxID=743722 RepID=F4CB76_SPHS2
MGLARWGWLSTLITSFFGLVPSVKEKSTFVKNKTDNHIKFYLSILNSCIYGARTTSSFTKIH